jgi:hypothetical protein
MPKSTLLSVILFCFVFSSQASDRLVLRKHIPVNKARLLSVDPLGHIYLVKENNSLLKFSVQGDSLGTFNEIKKGKITAIDASNPLRVLLLYGDYNQLVVLNTMMSQRSTLSLNMLGVSNQLAMAASADGNIWLFDAVAGEFIKVDENRQILLRVSVRNQSQEISWPARICESDRSVYLVDTSNGIRKFDLYGLYLNTYHFPGSDVTVMSPYIFYYQAPTLHAYQMQTLTETALQIPDPAHVIQYQIFDTSFYVLRPDGLDIYQLKQD